MTDTKLFFLEVGKRYVTRNGRVTGPIYEVPMPGCIHSFACVIGENTYTYTAHGAFFHGHVSQDDLVKEYIEQPAAKKFIVELGKRYVARNGKVSAPVQKWSSPNYPFMAYFDGVTRTFTDQGSVAHHYPDSYDLVAEYIEAPAAKPFTIEVGKRYLTRDGMVSDPVYKEKSNHPVYKFTCVINGKFKHYTACGAFMLGREMGDDLVAEYIEPLEHITISPVIYGAATVGAEPVADRQSYKWAEVKEVFRKGAQVECALSDKKESMSWRITSNPTWEVFCQYRVVCKPEAYELLERSRKFAAAGDNMELYDAITVYLNKVKA